MRGQHFLVDDFENGVGPVPESAPASEPVNPFDFIGDVKERTTKAPRPPQPPSLRNTIGGFPAHHKRLVPAKFKKKTQDAATEETAVPGAASVSVDEADYSNRPGDNEFMKSVRPSVDAENKQRLADMSPEEIEEERAELLRSLDPSLIERLLGRATINEMGRATIEEGGSDADFPGLENKQEPVTQLTESQPTKPKESKPRKSVTFAEPAQDSASSKNHTKDDIAGHISAAEESLPLDSTIHFPQPTQPPSLDPTSATFLDDLHDKYFPSLPSDPDKLAWMRSEPPNTYAASQTSLNPKDIRFSFAGTLIPPRLAAQIPVTAGLHHHGDAPDAAGYTIPELAMLARSSVPGQRCMAFQTLGRVMYRLGKGEFGNAGDGSAGTVGAEETLGELARGLWGEVEREGVIEICVAESEGKVAGGRHVSARAYATEAVWLWQKGGGRRWKAA